NWRQDEDVLDTWFSSALWPFSTMGWPDIESKDFNRYFPTDVLVTGYDIIFFWVARMIFQSLEFTEQKPFSDVLIHGLIRASDGQKMSKSLGNGVDPMDVIEKYGADSLRYFLLTGSTPGQDLRFHWERVESTLSDQWILTRLNETIQHVTNNTDKYEFGEAGRALYNFIWDDYCDWYIEMAKIPLNADDEVAKHTTRSVLAHVLDEIMRMLHPYMPFITEEIWQQIPHEGESITVAAWPTYNESYHDEVASKEMKQLVDII